VADSPVTISANAVAASYTVTAAPSPMAFGSWSSGVASLPMTLTVINSGNSQLASLTYAITGSAAFTRQAGAAGGTCGGTLAANSSCTVNVVFTPTSAAAFNGTLTVANAAAPAGQRITPNAVPLTGAGVAGQATVSITPNPKVITLFSQATNPLDAGSTTMVGEVTLTNTAAAGGPQVGVSGVAVSTTTRGFNNAFQVGANAGPDTCTGIPLAPQASCTVAVRFSVSANAPRGATVNGTIRFTDNATGSPQTGQLRGVVTP
jgi:hypothetical protein